ncbi:MAG: PASTA domain-containing protein [Rubrobacter sp.]|nr:PASTA domain-containing protein [Rubrobacter sp.]
MAIYSVDEASEQLGIPRPTLYRYLREYSIPSAKKSGRISIPEDSFEKIRHARDLHKEGLGTGAVRMRLSGTAEPVADTGEIALKLDRLSRDLETFKGDPKALEEASSPHALRTILARQSLLISAVFNLTEMVETLLRSTGQPRRPDFEDGPELREPNVATGIGGSGTRLARSHPVGHTIRLSASSDSPRVTRSERRAEREFGSLAKRRRKGAIVAAAALAAIVILAVLLFSLAGSSSDAEGDAAPQADTRREIQVPDLSDLTYPEAESRLDEAGLAIEERESREGEVVGQNPEAGEEASEGDTVSVTLDSDGEDTESSGASQYGNDEFEFTE